jgi:hypothetical protein
VSTGRFIAEKQAETRDYRYWDGGHAEDHRNLQWRMEQIEAKLDDVLRRLPDRALKETQ